MRHRTINAHIFTGSSLCLVVERADRIFHFSLVKLHHTNLKVKHQRKAAYKQLFSDA